MVIKHRCEHGFTLVEIMIALVIAGILSSFAISSYREQTKKAHGTEVKIQLSAASRKLISATSGFAETTEANCIANAELHHSKNFAYSCKKRDGDSNIFDIAAKPLRDIGVGGVLSFGIGYDKICWATCDAQGSGVDAELSKSHLGISDNCSALTRKERDYPCNCTNETYETCGWRNCNCICPPGWGCNCDRCYRCDTRTRKVCETCTDITYVNEDGVVVE